MLESPQRFGCRRLAQVVPARKNGEWWRREPRAAWAASFCGSGVELHGLGASTGAAEEGEQHATRSPGGASEELKKLFLL